MSRKTTAPPGGPGEVAPSSCAREIGVGTTHSQAPGPPLSPRSCSGWSGALLLLFLEILGLPQVSRNFADPVGEVHWAKCLQKLTRSREGARRPLTLGAGSGHQDGRAAFHSPIPHTEARPPDPPRSFWDKKGPCAGAKLSSGGHRDSRTLGHSPPLTAPVAAPRCMGAVPTLGEPPPGSGLSELICKVGSRLLADVRAPGEQTSGVNCY